MSLFPFEFKLVTRLFVADYTAQDYFEGNGELLFPNAQSYITETCLTCLSFEAFGRDIAVMIKSWHLSWMQIPYVISWKFLFKYHEYSFDFLIIIIMDQLRLTLLLRILYGLFLTGHRLTGTC